MYSRVLQCHVQPNKFDEFRTALNNTVLPELENQPGFVDVLETSDAATGEFVCVSLWETREDADRWGNTTFNELARDLAPLLAGPPTVRTLQVETSSMHNIAKGKAA